MTRHLTLFASAALAVCLSGCLGTENRGLESVHQPVVERNEYALELQTSGNALAIGEQARLGDWFEAMQLGYGDRVLIGGGDGLDSVARAEIGGIVAGYGLLIAGDASMLGTPVTPGALRVVVSRMRASVPGCPDWSRPGSRNPDSHTSSNYGCSVNSNLAAMVASPGDLVRGRPGSPSIDPASSTKAVDIYRKATPTGAGGIKAEKAGGR